MLDLSEIQTFEHDVLVIGAGGAGLRSAIECSARGMNTGLMCKSLLGKAHTVMAEGGVAAALGNVDRRDNWKVHFRDTMRGGKFLTSGAWPNCTPGRLPTACVSWRNGGRCSIAPGKD